MKAHRWPLSGERLPALLAIGILASALVGCAGADNDRIAAGAGTTSTSVQDDGSGWSATIAVGAPGSPDELLLVGQHRLSPESGKFEARAVSYRMSRDGILTAIESPPLDGDVGGGYGTVVDGMGYVVVNQCVVGGDPGSGGFGCVPNTIEHRFLGYNFARDEWSELASPPQGRTASGPRPISGQAGNESIFFGLASPLGADVFDEVIAYHPQSDAWTSVLKRQGGLPALCANGSTLHAFDGQGLLDEFARLDAEGLTGVHPIAASLRTITADGAESAEPLTLWYPTEAGLAPVNVLTIRPWCMSDGALLVTVAPRAVTDESVWPFRTADGDWLEIPPDKVLGENHQWEGIALPHAVVFASSNGTNTESATGGPRPAVYFSPADRAWHHLEDRDETSRPHLILAGGPRLIFTIQPVGDPVSGFSTLEIG